MAAFPVFLLQEWRRHVAKDQPCFELLCQQDFVGINHLVAPQQESDWDMGIMGIMGIMGHSLSVGVCSWTHVMDAYF